MQQRRSMKRSLFLTVAALSSLTLSGCGLAEDLGHFGFRAPLQAGGCVITGCSGHVCADGPLETTCEWREAYACYANAPCERQADGQCGWTQTPSLTACLGGPVTDAGLGTVVDAGVDQDGGAAPCVRGGCSGQLCGETAQSTTCEWHEAYVCYQQATCERQADGQCAFTQDLALTSCLDALAPDAGTDLDGGAAPCFVGGCSGQLCADEPLISTCEWTPAYACYAGESCERQADGQCGWTPSASLLACLAAAQVPEEGTDSGGCFRTGCSAHVCSDEEVITTCEWTPAYACFAKANCERQADGLCGFTHTTASLNCFAAASVEE